MQDNLNLEDIRGEDTGLEDAAVLISATMENIGVMTYQRIVPFVVVNNLIGQSAPILWRKLEQWAIALRDEQASPQAFEWFQWLAERLEEHNACDPEPAYVAHQSWKPLHSKRDIGS